VALEYWYYRDNNGRFRQLFVAIFESSPGDSPNESENRLEESIYS
jgi:hypothetical protein